MARLLSGFDIGHDIGHPPVHTLQVEGSPTDAAVAISDKLTKYSKGFILLCGTYFRNVKQVMKKAPRIPRTLKLYFCEIRGICGVFIIVA